ncbi:MAG: amidohydrolase [Methylobacterium mesophilicum]|nr:amidohydrolase [Methylobacterium mesophilicum]
MIIDTHLHLIDKAALDYPWLAGVPPLDRSFSYAEYAEQARALGIEAALHMEVDVAEPDIERETAHVARQAQEEGSLLQGAIASCRPERDDFPAMLERALADPFVKGFRRVLHVMPDDLSESALFRENIRLLGSTRLPFDLCVLPRQHGQATALADHAPDTQFVLDHCGVPDIKGEALDPWREQIAELARRPNIAAKISGVIAYADGESWTAETLRPYVEHVIERFGWDRVVWGSDWPVCTLGGGLARWVDATETLLRGAGEGEREKLLSANARRIWQLGQGRSPSPGGNGPR